MQLASTAINGDPGAGRDTQLSYLNRTDAETCPVPLFPEAGPEIALDGGNFTVVDTRP